MIDNTGITILYGSETGNAQEYSLFLFKKLFYLGLQCNYSSLDDFELKELVTKTKYLIIFCSTTGQGEIPRNGKKFLNFILKKNLPPDLLNHIKITSFGIGDSSYPKFNYAIKKLHTRLMQIGCVALCDRCEADEMSPDGVDGYYTEWEGTLVKALCDQFKLTNETKEENHISPRWNIGVQNDCRDIQIPADDMDISLSRTEDAEQMKIGRLVQNLRITSDTHFQDVRHIIIESEDLEYMPGDTICLYPSNDPLDVQRLLESQKHWLPIADKPLKNNGTFPNINGGIINREYLTLRNLLIHHIDIMSVPRRSFFMTLYHFVDPSTKNGDRNRKKLKQFGDIEFSEDLYDYANRPRRSILETLIEFEEDLEIPVEYIFDLFPLIKPRMFSIASKPTKNRVELIVAIVEYKTILRRLRKGLCTKWLKNKPTGFQLPFCIQKSNLKFSTKKSESPPIIMVATGTGIAPMKSLIENVVANNISQELYLYTGCRYKEKDFLLKDNWLELENLNKLSLYPSFSRDEGYKFKYVQDALYAYGKKVSDLLLKEDGIFFISGSSGAMPRQVRITILEILKKFGGLSENDAGDYVYNMEKERRYLQETW